MGRLAEALPQDKAAGNDIQTLALRRLTSQIRLGPMVKLLPMHHPIRIIEDMCVIDQLTDGRLEFGAKLIRIMARLQTPQRPA